MRKAAKSDMNLVVNIITETFYKNPGVNWLIKKRGTRKKKIRKLAQYAYIKSYMRDGVYISSNGKGVALCYKFNSYKFSFTELWYELRFALTAIKISRLIKVLKREARRCSIRPKSGEYYYFWFLGVLPEGKGAGFELNNAIFEKASKDNLPIYLETTIERNKKIYERIGYKEYHYWEDKKEDITFWFLKWIPSTAKTI
ncbi:MAG: hypothetical protein KAJ28_09020 [Flavobacteriaceae bacterium]|nr:hypothetical protein [Flavobacteriaceae bacterium]